MINDSLVNAETDCLSLRDVDNLTVSCITNCGIVDGDGVLSTRCEFLENSGTIATSVSMVCLTGSILIDGFAALENIFDSISLLPATISLDIPSVWKRNPF